MHSGYGRLAHATRAPRPAVVPYADWQAGVTPGNENLRVLLNGVPQPLAFAASISRGWVLVYAEPVPVIDQQNGHIAAHRIPRAFADENPTGSAAGFRRLSGDVRIVQDHC
jgi:hypothetical protein